MKLVDGQTLKEKIDYVNNARDIKLKDEIHFLFQSTKYTAERQKTFETIKTETNIDLSINENINENLNLLFDSDSPSSLNTLGKYIKYSSSERELLAQNMDPITTEIFNI